MLRARGPHSESFGPHPAPELLCLPVRWAPRCVFERLGWWGARTGRAVRSARPPTCAREGLPTALWAALNVPLGPQQYVGASHTSPSRPLPRQVIWMWGLSAWGSGSLHTLNPVCPFPVVLTAMTPLSPRLPQSVGPLQESLCRGGPSLYSALWFLHASACWSSLSPWSRSRSSPPRPLPGLGHPP